MCSRRAPTASFSTSTTPAEPGARGRASVARSRPVLAPILGPEQDRRRRPNYHQQRHPLVVRRHQMEQRRRSGWHDQRRPGHHLLGTGTPGRVRQGRWSQRKKSLPQVPHQRNHLVRLGEPGRGASFPVPELFHGARTGSTSSVAPRMEPSPTGGSEPAARRSLLVGTARASREGARACRSQSGDKACTEERQSGSWALRWRWSSEAGSFSGPRRRPGRVDRSAQRFPWALEEQMSAAASKN